MVEKSGGGAVEAVEKLFEAVRCCAEVGAAVRWCGAVQRLEVWVAARCAAEVGGWGGGAVRRGGE